MFIFRFILKIIGYLSGHTSMREAEEKWTAKYGEIPDGHCLVRCNGVCELKSTY